MGYVHLADDAGRFWCFFYLEQLFSLVVKNKITLFLWV